jgi:HEPN domain-containing protein
LVERSADWLAQAKRDLESANYEMEGQYFEWGCFLSQQAAEKAVKAVYQKIGGEAFGHSVAGLLGRLPALKKDDRKKEEISELIALAKELDKAYISARYPNSHPEGAPFNAYTEAEAKRSIDYAGRILRFCEHLLSEL